MEETANNFILPSQILEPKMIFLSHNFSQSLSMAQVHRKRGKRRSRSARLWEISSSMWFHNNQIRVQILIASQTLKIWQLSKVKFSTVPSTRQLQTRIISKYWNPGIRQNQRCLNQEKRKSKQRARTNYLVLWVVQRIKKIKNSLWIHMATSISSNSNH